MYRIVCKTKKIFYRLLKNALLFYINLAGNLTNLGFNINLYEPCVVNKLIQGKQMTKFWHVDDLQISHADPKEMTRVIRKLDRLYGNMRVSRGKYHG